MLSIFLSLDMFLQQVKKLLYLWEGDIRNDIIVKCSIINDNEILYLLCIQFQRQLFVPKICR